MRAGCDINCIFLCFCGQFVWYFLFLSILFSYDCLNWLTVDWPSDWTGSPRLAASCRLSSCVSFTTNTPLCLFIDCCLCVLFLSLQFVFLFFFFSFLYSWRPFSPASSSWSPRACFLSVPWLFSHVPLQAGIHAWTHREEQERTNKQRNKQTVTGERMPNCKMTERERERQRERSDKASLRHLQQKPTH